MKKYLITSKEFYTDTPATFKKKLLEQFKEHKPEYALYRDKSNPNYDAQAVEFLLVCKSQNVKSFLHQKVDLAKKLGATGVHLTSIQFDEISRAKSIGLEVIISTHTEQEVKKAQELGANAVTYSPIFASPNKGKPKGLEDLQKVLSQCSINVFALGGIISQEQVEKIKSTNAYGFASIRYFV